MSFKKKCQRFLVWGRRPGNRIIMGRTSPPIVEKQKTHIKQCEEARDEAGDDYFKPRHLILALKFGSFLTVLLLYCKQKNFLFQDITRLFSSRKYSLVQKFVPFFHHKRGTNFCTRLYFQVKKAQCFSSMIAGGI